MHPLHPLPPLTHNAASTHCLLSAPLPPTAMRANPQPLRCHACLSLVFPPAGARLSAVSADCESAAEAEKGISSASHPLIAVSQRVR